jgi:alkaline phosphatase D
MSAITRRDFLKLTTVSATATSTSILTACGGRGNSSSITIPASRFPQSVASGDPKANSVILWTRVADTAKPGADLVLSLEVSTRNSFPSGSTMVFNNLNALAANDNCLKVKVTDLNAGTTYYYRFTYAGTTGNDASNIGRTKTAAAIGTDVEVNYALLSCQDYIGRYYNTLKRLVELSEEDGNDLDFVVQVGDYIYETSGDPSFQSVGGERSVSFTNNAEALAVTKNGQTFYAAQSVGNYRDLYKIYRSDEMLQRVHERFPMISTWDDHEFSDDCHKDTATYTDGKNTLPDNSKDIEQSTSRRQAAEQAYFDYMPIEPQAGTIEGTDKSVTTDTAMLFPNATLYRNFQFGDNFELIMTDYRSYRPDHFIPENAIPGEVAMNEAELLSTLKAAAVSAAAAGTEAATAAALAPVSTLDALITATGAGASPFAAFSSYDLFGYFTFGTSTNFILTPAEVTNIYTALTIVMAGEGYPLFAANAKAQADIQTGAPFSIFYYNLFATAFNTGIDSGTVPAGTAKIPTVAEVLATKGTAVISGISDGRGISYATMGKQSVFTNYGSRYLVVKEIYDLFNIFKTTADPVAGQTFGLSGTPEADNAYGTDQWTYIQTRVASSTAKFIGIGNSVSTASLMFDQRVGGALDIALQAQNPPASVSALPAVFQQRFYPNADHWDGFPVRKATIIGTLAGAAAANTSVSGAFFMSGDIHASFVSDNTFTSGATTLKIPDFTTPATSSGTWGQFISDAFNDIATSFTPTQKALGEAALVTGLDNTMTLSANTAASAGDVGANNLMMADSVHHGFTTFKVTSSKMTATYHLIAQAHATTNLYGEAATATQAKFTTQSFDYTGGVATSPTTLGGGVLTKF